VFIGDVTPVHPFSDFSSCARACITRKFPLHSCFSWGCTYPRLLNGDAFSVISTAGRATFQKLNDIFQNLNDIFSKLNEILKKTNEIFRRLTKNTPKVLHFRLFLFTFANPNWREQREEQTLMASECACL